MPQYYIGSSRSDAVFHIVEDGVVKCGAELSPAQKSLWFPRIDPELASQTYILCVECEPDVKAHPGHRESDVEKHATHTETAPQGGSGAKVAQKEESMVIQATDWREYERHELSELCGDIPQADFRKMVDGARKTEAVFEIVLYEGKVLDGWHRYLCAIEVDIEPVFTYYEGTDPASFVLYANVHRRHNTQSQVAQIRVRLQQWQDDVAVGAVAKMVSGNTEESFTQSELAGFAKPSDRTMRAAKRAERAGLGDMVISGEISTSLADKVITEGLDGELRSGELKPEDAWGEVNASRAARKETNGTPPGSDRAAPVAVPEPEEPESIEDMVAEDIVTEDVTAERTDEPPLTAIEREMEGLRSENEILQAHADDDRRTIEELRERITFVEAECSGIPEQHEALFQRYNANIEAARASIRNLQREKNDINREKTYWENRAREAEAKLYTPRKS